MSATDADVAGVATRDVSLLEVRRYDGERTAALGVFTALFAVIVAAFIYVDNNWGFGN